MKDVIIIDFINEEQFKAIMSWYSALQQIGMNTVFDDHIARQLRKDWSDLIGE